MVTGRRAANLTEVEGLAPAFRAIDVGIAGAREWQAALEKPPGGGSCPWNRVSVSPVRDPMGNITHFVATLDSLPE